MELIWVVPGAFAALFLTHTLALYAGWRMGSQRGKEYYVPPSFKKEKGPESSGIDELDKERLDYE